MAKQTLTELDRKYQLAFALAVFSILYNITEGLISTYFGFEDESLVLFGFGADSFIEVISGLGIAHMIIRIWRWPDSDQSKFERTALKVTGISFFILVIGLVFSSGYNLWTGHQPLTTLLGVIISIISISVMWGLVVLKRKVGHQLDSKPILADANCTMVCVYMSVILLLSSALYEWAHIPYVDSLGTLGLAYFSFREGKECFDKARNNPSCGCKDAGYC
jgi:divalent metal cation (Fe/Co/Zn/Cd) transporter